FGAGGGGEDERVVGLAQVAGRLAVRHVAAGAAHGAGDEDVGGNLAATALEVAQDAADVGMLDAAGEEPAGLHHLMAGVVDRGGGVVDGADQGELVGQAGQAREDFADLHARNAGGDGPEGAADLGGGIG